MCPQKRKKRKAVPLGRPRMYHKEIGKYICYELQKGKTLTSISKKDGMPSLPTIFKWLNPLSNKYQEEFAKAYKVAREIQAEVMADQIADISDDSLNDTMEVTNKKGEKETIVLHDNIKRSALRIETRKWIAAHLLPRKFGDKVQLTGKDDQPLIPGKINLVVDFGEDEKE
ncbi:MAG TPA: hypothetical protein PK941_07825 [Paludibacter sp.]|nr:hypothetical protein [Paludibacter sp.]